MNRNNTSSSPSPYSDFDSLEPKDNDLNEDANIEPADSNKQTIPAPPPSAVESGVQETTDLISQTCLDELLDDTDNDKTDESEPPQELRHSLISR